MSSNSSRKNDVTAFPESFCEITEKSPSSTSVEISGVFEIASLTQFSGRLYNKGDGVRELRVMFGVDLPLYLVGHGGECHTGQEFKPLAELKFDASRYVFWRD
jgi:hypothetical protein